MRRLAAALLTAFRCCNSTRPCLRQYHNAIACGFICASSYGDLAITLTLRDVEKAIGRPKIAVSHVFRRGIVATIESVGRRDKNVKMKNKVKILLQTTIPYTEDDWSVNRFSLLREHLSSIENKEGQKIYEVVARDRLVDSTGDDQVLSRLDISDFDQLWLFAVDIGDGLTKTDCEGITRFRQRGGGMLATRDHQDLGSSLCTLGGVGRAHFFHSQYQDPDVTRNQIDDQDTPTISWPNYHSGSNGNYQRVNAVEPVHELMISPHSSSGVIEFFPAHPHEGGVGVPEGDQNARVVATGLSKVTNRPFNLVVALDRCSDEHGNELGRAVAESSFHHFVDYNWDLSKGCPTFLVEPPGEEIKKDPSKLADIKSYVANLAAWLAPDV